MKKYLNFEFITIAAVSLLFVSAGLSMVITKRYDDIGIITISIFSAGYFFSSYFYRKEKDEWKKEKVEYIKFQEAIEKAYEEAKREHHKASSSTDNKRANKLISLINCSTATDGEILNAVRLLHKMKIKLNKEN